MEFEHIGERNAEIQEPYIDRLNRMAPNGLNPCLYHAYNPQPLTCDDCAKNVVEQWNGAVARLAKDPRHLERKLIGFTQEQLMEITKNQITRLEELEAKNASLTLQNEALRKCLEPFAEYGECVPPSLEKVCVTIMLNYGGSGKKVNGTTLLDCSLQGQAFINALHVFSQPHPDPDKISAVVKAAVQFIKTEEFVMHFMNNGLPFETSRQKLFKAVEAYLNDKKGN